MSLCLLEDIKIFSYQFSKNDYLKIFKSLNLIVFVYIKYKIADVGLNHVECNLGGIQIAENVFCCDFYTFIYFFQRKY